MRKFVLAVVLVLVASSAQAATLNVVGGQLIGASGVIVDGSSYNVEFQVGTCIDLYSGCDDVSDFTFQTAAAAVLASQAIVDQVWVDVSVESFPVGNGGFFVGCDASTCAAVTPYGVDPFTPPSLPDLPAPIVVGYARFLLVTDPGPPELFSAAFPGTSDGRFLDGFGVVYAVWSVGSVPEPGTGLLMGLGLLGVSVSNRRQR